MPTTLDLDRPFVPLNIAILTISDTRTLEDDVSGTILQTRIEKAGHHIAQRQICRDDVSSIQTIIKKWCDEDDIAVIITTGGTGFTGRDVTPEAVEPLLDKRMDGFSHLFHMVSFQKIGRVTIQSRALAGLRKNSFIFCLPGSSGAVKDAWDDILAGELDSRQTPSNLVDLMPRLSER